MQFFAGWKVCRGIQSATQWPPFHAGSVNAQHMQNRRHDVRQISRFLDHRTLSEGATLHHQHGRKLRTMQAAMHAAAFGYIGRIEGGRTWQAPFIQAFFARECRDQIGAARMG